MTGVVAAHILQKPLAGVGAAGFQRAHLVEQAQALGFQFVEPLGARLVLAFGRALLDGAAHALQLADGLGQLGPRLLDAPGGAQGVHGALHRAFHRHARGFARHGVAELVKARAPPAVVDDLLQAAAAAGVQPRLQSHGLRAGAQARLFPLAQRFGAPRPFRTRRRRFCGPRRDGSGRFNRSGFNGRGRFHGPDLDGPGHDRRVRFGRFRPLGRLRRPGKQSPRRGQHHAGLFPGKAAQARLAAKAGQYAFLLAGEFHRALHALHGRRAPQRRSHAAVFVAEEYARRARQGHGQGHVGRILRRGAVQHLKEHARGRLDDHVRIDDIGVGLGAVHAIVLVGADLVVLARVGAQVEQRVAPDAPHARLEMAGFVFVRHDAQAAVLGKRLRAVEGQIAALLRHQQGLEAKIALEGVILLEDAYA